MANFIVMPKLGLTMSEGSVSNWRKKEGDSINKGEILFDVETDKLTNEFESTSEGVLRKILVKEATVAVLTPLAIVGTLDEDISALLKQAGKEAEPERAFVKTEIKQAEKQPETIATSRAKASPRAKKLALELGIDINLVTGTGPDGSVTENDIKNYKEQPKENKKASPTAAVVAEILDVDIYKIQKDSRIMKDDVVKFKLSEELEKYASPQEHRKPMSTMRKVIARRMLESKQISPSVTFNIKVDTSGMKQLRDELMDTYKVSYNDILVKIISKVLLEYPLLNSSLEDNQIITRNYVNMGVAVALSEGLLVPVIKYANVKTLKEISSEIKALSAKARSNELLPDDLTGGTFTISNLGMFGIESFSPIINQPEVAIMGINAIKEEAVVEKGEIKIKPMMNLSLTADHRVVDGAVAAEFLSKLKVYIEKPGLLLL